MIHYTSTRDASVQYTPKQALRQGLSKEGGLFVLETIPKINIQALLDLDYQAKTVAILEAFFDDFSHDELVEAVKEAYTNQFDDPAYVPLKQVGNRYVLELFHGPTCAFKDMALRILPQLLKRYLKESNQKTTIVTATSGDTGKAALAGFAHMDACQIVVLYPKGLVSKTQERQMITQEGDNVHVWAIEGTFDDCQRLAKQALQENAHFSSANSINIGRLVPQIVYYIEAYAQLIHKDVISYGQPINFSVPTGNFGDVLAGYIAKEMGLPINKLLVASNANHVVADFLQTGCYDRRRDFVKTISPSMDILVSSNLERLLYAKAPTKVKGWMQDLQEKGYYQVDQATLETIQEDFIGRWLDEDACKQTIKNTYQKTGYVLDPHTAVAYGASQDLEGVTVVLSTANPYKFEADVRQVLGQSLESCGLTKPENLAKVQAMPILHQTSYTIEQAKQALEAFHD